MGKTKNSRRELNVKLLGQGKKQCMYQGISMQRSRHFFCLHCISTINAKNRFQTKIIEQLISIGGKINGWIKQFKERHGNVKLEFATHTKRNTYYQRGSYGLKLQDEYIYHISYWNLGVQLLCEKRTKTQQAIGPYMQWLYV